MRQGWEYNKLGDVCEIKADFIPKPEELSETGKYPYYKVADMNTEGNEVYLDVTCSFKENSFQEVELLSLKMEQLLQQTSREY